MSKTPDLTGSREFCMALLEAAPDALVVVDAEGRIVMVNAQFEKMFGFARHEVRGHPIELLMPERLRASHEKQRDLYQEAPVLRPMGIGLELTARRRDGTEVPVEIALSPLDSAFGPLTIAIVRDMTGRKETEEKLRFLSGHDTLTGLFNRYAFEQHQARLARGRQFPVSIAVLDLDSLKEINDLFGHTAGDEMLKRAAAVLVQAFRAEDTVARVGGDEFAVLLPSTGREAALAGADRVRRLLSRHNATTAGPALGLSIGVATAERGQSLAQCLREADQAMYRDKLCGTGRTGRSG